MHGDGQSLEAEGGVCEVVLKLKDTFDGFASMAIKDGAVTRGV